MSAVLDLGQRLKGSKETRERQSGGKTSLMPTMKQKIQSNNGMEEENII